jgi:hypothetical protein
VVFDTLWFTLLKGQAQFLLPTMANDPKVASRAAGTIAVQLGRKALDQRLTVSSIIWSALSQLAIKGVLSVPATMSNTINNIKSTDPETVLKNVDTAHKSLEVVLSESEKNTILKELKDNPIKIASIFGKIIMDLKTPPK